MASRFSSFARAAVKQILGRSDNTDCADRNITAAGDHGLDARRALPTRGSRVAANAVVATKDR